MLMPGKNVPQVSVEYFDKIVHLMSYAVLTWLLLKGLRGRKLLKNYFVITAVISIGYGIALELSQGFIPERSVDAADIIANTAGTVISLTIFPYVNK